MNELHQLPRETAQLLRTLAASQIKGQYPSQLTTDRLRGKLAMMKQGYGNLSGKGLEEVSRYGLDFSNVKHKGQKPIEYLLGTYETNIHKYNSFLSHGATLTRDNVTRSLVLATNHQTTPGFQKKMLNIHVLLLKTYQKNINLKRN